MNLLQSFPTVYPHSAKTVRITFMCWRTDQGKFIRFRRRNRLETATCNTSEYASINLLIIELSVFNIAFRKDFVSLSNLAVLIRSRDFSNQHQCRNLPSTLA